MNILVLLFALIAPLALWPIEIFFPYPHVAEELTKAMIVFFVLQSPKTSQKIYLALLIGFLFGLSENFLYLFTASDAYSHILRFMVTMPLHIITALIILLPTLIHKRLIFLGIILASFIHYFFNLYISSWVG